MRSVSRAEQETIIRWGPEEGVASIDTANPAMIRRLDRLVEAHPDAYRCVREDAAYLAKRYTAPAALIRFGKPASAAKKAAGRERAEALRRG